MSPDNQKLIAEGKLASLGLFDEQQIKQANQLISMVGESELETIRVLFADQHGILRGKTIVAGAFPSIFTEGLAVASTLLLKDTSHRTVFPVWSEKGYVPAELRGANDVLLVPDPDTFQKLPWSPHSAWIFCNPCLKSGESLSFSSRDILQNAISKLAAAKMKMLVGLEVEFHVFAIEDPALDHASATMPGQPIKTRNLAQGYQFLTETRYSELEHVIDELRRNCETIGLPVRSMEIEMGPSQIEFTFDPTEPLVAADNMMIFRTLVKEVCAQKNLHATFMCKPKLDNTAAGGWHLHQSVLDINSGENLMTPASDNTLTDVAGGWIAGLLEHARETCLLTTPTVNGYKRYLPHQLAPNRIQWGKDNRGTMIRSLINAGDPASRIENRVAETTANPYLYIASQILSGLDGVKRNLTPPDPVEAPYEGDELFLPSNLSDAIQYFEQSEFYRRELGEEFVNYLSHIRRAEWDRYNLAISEWEHAEYFGLY